MSDTIEQPPAANARGAERAGNVARTAGWGRNHTIVLLIALSLTPGLAAAVDRAWWHALPPGVRMSAYVICGILIVAACALMLGRGEEPPGTQP